MKIVVVTAAYDRSFAIVRHDERQRRRSDLPGVDRDPIPGRHVQEHATEPVVGDGCEQVRQNSQLRTAEGGRDRVAAERDGVGRRHMLFVARRHPVGQKGDVNISLSDEECLHRCCPGIGSDQLATACLNAAIFIVAKLEKVSDTA